MALVVVAVLATWPQLPSQPRPGGVNALVGLVSWSSFTDNNSPPLFLAFWRGQGLEGLDFPTQSNDQKEKTNEQVSKKNKAKLAKQQNKWKPVEDSQVKTKLANHHQHPTNKNPKKTRLPKAVGLVEPLHEVPKAALSKHHIACEDPEGSEWWTGKQRPGAFGSLWLGYGYFKTTRKAAVIWRVLLVV